MGGFMGKNYTDFNPRPTCVGRLGTFMATPMTANFNPRPTCVGRRKLSSRERVVKILQSTPHMRGATTSVATRTLADRPSIHAPHAWGDSLYHGGWRSIDKLQSTPHMRGATVHCLIYRPHRCACNPRPTCVGRPLKPQSATGNVLLQSTSHMRGATAISHMASWLFELQSTPHMRGATP